MCLDDYIDYLLDTIRQDTKGECQKSRVPKIKIQEKSPISFCKISKIKWYDAKVLPKIVSYILEHNLKQKETSSEVND